jgi:Pyruvate kinase, barrel domain
MRLPMSQRPNRTKIVATIGPASSARGTLERMIEAGVNVARLKLRPWRAREPCRGDQHDPRGGRRGRAAGRDPG